jgi:hypothetical protein
MFSEISLKKINLSTFLGEFITFLANFCLFHFLGVFFVYILNFVIFFESEIRIAN